MVRIFSEKNKQNFKNKLNQYDWNINLRTKNATDSMTIFYHKLAECYNSSFPVLRLSRKRAKDKPWVTTAIKQSITKKHNLFTGVSISSNCMRKQFLFQRHNFNVTDLLLKTVEQKVVTFQQNRIREQLDDMRTPVRTSY